MRLSESEIERRIPVWVALADLFLDTELQSDDYRRIADALSASGYPRDRLRKIFLEEVTPAFAFNLRDIAGEWAGWPDAFVRDRIMDILTAKGPVNWIGKRLSQRQFPQDCWSRIEAMLSA